MIIAAANVFDSNKYVGAQVSTLPRPGGLHQLALNGRRAYTFVGDTKPGLITGDRFVTGGQTPGQNYIWRAVVVPKSAPTEIVLTPR